MIIRSDRPPYVDRDAAGEALSEALSGYRGRADVVVLALPRGGVPVAFRVARSLAAPLDVLVVRKIRLPAHPEVAMGAVAVVGAAVEVYCNDEVMQRFQSDGAEFDRARRAETAVVVAGLERYRRTTPTAVFGRVAIVVDDGLATGSTMQAAIRALRHAGPSRVVAAVPIASGRSLDELQTVADEVVCPWVPAWFTAVGQGYRDFSPTTDAEVARILATG